MMEQTQIEEIIPHRPPFLWIDRVEELKPGVHCIAWKWIDPENPAFDGHFPARPILPGVYLIEAMAQTAGVMMASVVPAAGTQQETGGVPLLAAVNRFKFLKPVLPGQELRIETRKLTEAGTMAYIEGTVTANGETVARGELSVVSG